MTERAVGDALERRGERQRCSPDTINAIARLDLFCTFSAMARSDSAKINLALHVLRDACVRCGAQNVATPEARLALNVLDTYLPDFPALAEFWRHASNAMCHPWESGHALYRHIVGRLESAGWKIDPANVL